MWFFWRFVSNNSPKQILAIARMLSVIGGGGGGGEGIGRWGIRSTSQKRNIGRCVEQEGTTDGGETTKRLAPVPLHNKVSFCVVFFPLPRHLIKRYGPPAPSGSCLARGTAAPGQRPSGDTALGHCRPLQYYACVCSARPSPVPKCPKSTLLPRYHIFCMSAEMISHVEKWHSHSICLCLSWLITGALVFFRILGVGFLLMTDLISGMAQNPQRNPNLRLSLDRQVLDRQGYHFTEMIPDHESGSMCITDK